MVSGVESVSEIGVPSVFVALEISAKFTVAPEVAVELTCSINTTDVDELGAKPPAKSSPPATERTVLAVEPTKVQPGLLAATKFRPAGI